MFVIIFEYGCFLFFLVGRWEMDVNVVARGWSRGRWSMVGGGGRERERGEVEEQTNKMGYGVLSTGHPPGIKPGFCQD
jgi:hypothetical protein